MDLKIGNALLLSPAIFISCLFFWHPPVAADEYLVDRVRFKQARRLLHQGKEAAFLSAIKQFDQYPIKHYLEYKWLLRDLNRKGTQSAIQNFTQQHPSSHLASQLYSKWQLHLFSKKRWSAFIQAQQHSQAKEYPCRLKEAQIHTGAMKASQKQLRNVWLAQSMSSSACRRTAQLILKSVKPSAELLWARVERLMYKGKWRDAQKMQTFFNQRDQAQLALWIDTYRNPGDNADNAELKADTVFNRRIVLQQHNRWVRYAPIVADKHWQKIRKNYQFEEADRQSIDRYIALKMAYAGLPEAGARLAALKQQDEDTRLWRIRSALRAQNWTEVRKGIAALPVEQRGKEQWQYWLARAHEEYKQTGDAKAIYQHLAKAASYHGFLSADRLGLDYAIRNEAPTYSEEKKAALLKDPAVIRAREYFLVGLRVDARQVWKRVTKQRSQEELAIVATLASEWGWHDRAIFTINRTPFKRSLTLRFPMPYDDKVFGMARRNKIDPAWVYGVMRRESAFIADIRSHAGAIGLMQLMPKTAEYVAEQMGRKVRTGDLIDEHVNVSLGTHYLRYVMNKFDDHQVLATAAYNAGPHRVSQWLPRDKTLPADIWVDTIPFTETRRYVRAVMAYTTIFEWQMEQRATTPLAKRMPRVFITKK